VVSKDLEEKLLSRHNEAIENEFYLEAIAIVFHLLELRTRSVITTFSGTVPGNKVKIKKAIIRIKKHRKQHPSLESHFTNALFNQVLDWKTARDNLMHQLVRDDLDNFDVDKIAANGLAVYNDFTDAHASWLKDFHSQS